MADGADWGGRGRRGGGGRIGSSLEGRKGRTGKPRAGVLANWSGQIGMRTSRSTGLFAS